VQFRRIKQTKEKVHGSPILPPILNKNTLTAAKLFERAIFATL
jgi:hypothetical protein